MLYRTRIWYLEISTNVLPRDVKWFFLIVPRLGWKGDSSKNYKVEYVVVTEKEVPEKKTNVIAHHGYIFDDFAIDIYKNSNYR